MDSDVVHLVGQVVLCLDQVRRTLSKLLLDSLYALDVVDLARADLLPQQLCIAEQQDHVLFFETDRGDVLLELIGPIE